MVRAPQARVKAQLAIGRLEPLHVLVHAQKALRERRLFSTVLGPSQEPVRLTVSARRVCAAVRA
jgi:hypothetical protein